jgi:putative transposase
MPRVARIKNNESVTYIIIKGISDVPLFREDEDKNVYMSLLKKYRDIYGFKLYAYCIMQDFAHFIIDLCGADISSIMSSVNIGYSGKYNRKYNRQGHLFHDRFKSKIVKDELELKALTLYIHNSPTTIREYKKHPEKYKYSSLGTYMGLEDPFNIVDENFIKEFIGESPEDRKKYLELVPMYDTKKLIEEVEIYSKTSNSKYYTKKAMPKIDPEEILDFISNHTGISKIRLSSKHVRSARDARALAAFIMKNIFNLKTSEICSALGNVCSANVTKLFHVGLNLVEENKEYSILVDELKKKYS